MAEYKCYCKYFLKDVYTGSVDEDAEMFHYFYLFVDMKNLYWVPLELVMQLVFGPISCSICASLL